MSFLSWLLNSVSAAALLGAALYFGRTLIVERLKRSIQHEFDVNLESLKAELRKSEESFKAELRKKEGQVEAIRSLALSGAGQQQAKLAERKVQAIASLWSTLIEMSPQRVAAEWMKVFKFDGAAKASAENERLRTAFKGFLQLKDPDPERSWEADRSRLFVSAYSWSLFSAFRAVVFFAMAQVKMIANGLDNPEFLNPQGVADLLKLAMPDRASHIDEKGQSVFPYLLDELERRLLDALKADLAGSKDDQATIERATAITNAAEQLAKRSLIEE